MQSLVRCARLSWLCILLALPALLGAGRQSAPGVPVRDPSGFTFTPPAGFTPLSQVVAQQPSILYAYGRENGAGEPITFVAYERLKGVIGREAMETFVPKDKWNLISKARWKDFEIDVFEVVEKLNGVEFVTYNAQVPLRPFAVQVKVGGPAARRAELRTLLTGTLAGLDGTSNWIGSLLPLSISGSPNYGLYLLTITIGCSVVGLAVLYLVGRKAPRGTVLAIAFVLLMFSVAIPSMPVREVLLLRGGLRLFSLVAIVLGIIEIVRRKRRMNTAAIAKLADGPGLAPPPL